jgi:outer membrane beta-barrel protein
MKNLIVIVVLVLVNKMVLAGENDLYDFLWLDPDKNVYVLQNKIYPKHKSLYFDLGYISGLSSEFQNTKGAQLKAGYFFREEWAFEVNFATYSHQNNSTYESLKIINGAEPFVRRTNKMSSAYIIWSPFYGKINTFNKIFYFDWSFGVGIGDMQSESNLRSVMNPSQPNVFRGEHYNPLLLKTGLKFHLNRQLHLGIEYQNTNFEAGSPKAPSKNEWRQSNDLIINIGVSF